METNDKSLFFLTLSLTCIWVVLDNIWGKKHLSNLVNNMFGLSDAEVDTPKETVKEVTENAFTGILGTDYIKEETKDGDEIKTTFKCPRCDKTFTSAGDYRTHKCNVSIFPKSFTIFGREIKIGG